MTTVPDLPSHRRALRAVDDVVAAVPGDGQTALAGLAVGRVEVAFRPLGPSLTRVELEHRGWERLSAAQPRSATAAAGGYARGWELVLAAFTTHLEGS